MGRGDVTETDSCEPDELEILGRFEAFDCGLPARFVVGGNMDVGESHCSWDTADDVGGIRMEFLSGDETVGEAIEALFDNEDIEAEDCFQKCDEDPAVGDTAEPVEGTEADAGD
jgi:hypothetical protein